MLAEAQGHLRLELRITNPAPHGFASHGAEGQRKLLLQPCSAASPRTAVAVAPSWPSPVPFAHQQWGLPVVEEEDEEGWRLCAPDVSAGSWPCLAQLSLLGPRQGQGRARVPAGDGDVCVSLPELPRAGVEGEMQGKLEEVKGSSMEPSPSVGMGGCQRGLCPMPGRGGGSTPLQGSWGHGGAEHHPRDPDAGKPSRQGEHQAFPFLHTELINSSAKYPDLSKRYQQESGRRAQEEGRHLPAASTSLLSPCSALAVAAHHRQMICSSTCRPSPAIMD